MTVTPVPKGSVPMVGTSCHHSSVRYWGARTLLSVFVLFDAPLSRECSADA
jgi:hypothetical protein